jgi:CRISPR-associated protein Cse2 family
MSDPEASEKLVVPPDPRSPIEAALDAIAGALRQLVEREATGELAALKRLDPERRSTIAFARLTLLPKVEALLARETDAAPRDDLIYRLAVITRAMAIAADDLHPGWKLGGAMSKIGATEQRVGSLLTARGPALLAAISRTAMRLAREGPLPYRQLGILALAETLDPGAAETTRFEIARDYERSQYIAGSGNA